MIFIPTTDLQKYLKIKKDKYSGLEIKIKDPFLSEKISNLILSKIKKKNISIYTWKDKYGYIYYDIKSMKTIIYIVVILIFLISAIGISSISTILLLKKQKEIKILKSIGVQNSVIQLICYIYGFRFIIEGLILGIIISLFIVYNFYYFIKKINCFLQSVINLKEIYFLNFIPMSLEIKNIFFSVSIVFILGFLTIFFGICYINKNNVK
ncbi:MAG: FtsX-like permease family protein [Buchnera aphidicola (Tetraneura akinire)]